MENKIFTLMILTLLSMIVLVSCASAVTLASWQLNSSGTATTVYSNVNAGTFTSSGVTFNGFTVNGANAENWSLAAINTSKYFQVTISPATGYSLTISDINFDYLGSTTTSLGDFELQYSKISGFGSPTSVIIKTDVNSTEKSSTNSLSVTVNSGETLTLRWFGYNFNADTNDFIINNLNILGTATASSSTSSDTPTEITACNTTGDNDGNLRIKKIKFTNNGISDVNFGDDDEWYAQSEVQIQIDVENNGDEKIEDIELNWGLWDDNSNEWIIEPTDEDKFDLKSDKEETITINLNLEKDLDINLDELDDGSHYKFYVYANGFDNENDTDVCASDYKDVTIVVESDFVVLTNINSQDLASCGDNVQITADVWNIGDNDQDDVYVKIFNSELGINERVDFSSIDAFDNEKLDATLSIPETAQEKVYYLRLDVYDENDDLFESNSDESSFLVPITVASGCSSSSSSGGSAVVSASLASGAKAGSDIIVTTTISNTGTKSATYTLNAANYGDWASTATLSESTFTLNAGASKQVTITLKANDDASGDKSFNVEVVSGNQIVTTQPVTVSVEPKSLLSGLGSGSGLIWAIGIINVILIVVIIIVAVKVVGK